MVTQLEKDKFVVSENRASIVLYKFLYSLKKRPKKFILPVNICPIVPEVFKLASIPCQFIDIQKDDFCIDRNKVYDSIKRGETSGVLVNYTYGVEEDFTTFFQDLRNIREDLIIIEDKCLCIPQINTPNDFFSDLILYSTGYAKFLELNWGGFAYFKVVNSDISVYNEINGELVLFNDKTKKREAVNLSKVPITIDKYFSNISKCIMTTIEQKELINSVYANKITNNIIPLQKEFNNWRYNILIKEKEEVLKSIFDNGLFASSHYKPLSSDISSFPIAYYLYDNVINLFNDFHFTEEKAIAVANILNKTLKSNFKK